MRRPTGQVGTVSTCSPECGFDLDAPLGFSTEILGALGEWVTRFLGRPPISDLSPRPGLLRSTCPPCGMQWGPCRLRIEAIATSSEPPQLTPWDPDQAAVDGCYSTSDLCAVYEQAVQAGEVLQSHLESMSDAEVSKSGIGVDGGSRGVPELAARAFHEVIHHGLDVVPMDLADRVHP